MDAVSMSSRTPSPAPIASRRQSQVADTLCSSSCQTAPLQASDRCSTSKPLTVGPPAPLRPCRLTNLMLRSPDLRQARVKPLAEQAAMVSSASLHQARSIGAPTLTPRASVASLLCGGSNQQCQRTHMQSLEEIFAEFCPVGRQMDSTTFVSFCRHCFLLSGSASSADACAIFAKSAQEVPQYITLQELPAALQLIADKRGISLEVVQWTVNLAAVSLRARRSAGVTRASSVNRQLTAKPNSARARHQSQGQSVHLTAGVPMVTRRAEETADASPVGKPDTVPATVPTYRPPLPPGAALKRGRSLAAVGSREVDTRSLAAADGNAEHVKHCSRRNRPKHIQSAKVAGEEKQRRAVDDLLGRELIHRGLSPTPAPPPAITPLSRSHGAFNSPQSFPTLLATPLQPISGTGFAPELKKTRSFSTSIMASLTL